MRIPCNLKHHLTKITSEVTIGEKQFELILFYYNLTVDAKLHGIHNVFPNGCINLNTELTPNDFI